MGARMQCWMLSLPAPDAGRRGLGHEKRSWSWEEFSLGLQPSLPRLNQRVSPWRWGRPACSAAIGWVLPGWAYKSAPGSLRTNGTDRPLHLILSEQDRVRERGEDHGEPVRREPCSRNAGGSREAPGGGAVAVSETWEPGSLVPEGLGGGSGCPGDAGKPGAEPRVWNRAAEPWGGQRRQGRTRESG